MALKPITPEVLSAMGAGEIVQKQIDEALARARAFSSEAAGIAHGLARHLGISVRVEPGAHPHTDTTGVLVVPPPASYEPGDIAAWHGLVDHECAHVLHTVEPQRSMKDLTKLEANCLNLLEDCRINHKLASDYWGCGDNLRSGYDWVRKQMGPAGETMNHVKGALCVGAQTTLNPDLCAALRDTMPPEGDAEGLNETWKKGEAWAREHRDEIMAADTMSLRPLAQEFAKMIADERDEHESKKPGSEGERGSAQRSDETEKAKGEPEKKEGEGAGDDGDPYSSAEDDTKADPESGERRPGGHGWAPPSEEAGETSMESMGAKLAEESEGKMPRDCPTLTVQGRAKIKRRALSKFASASAPLAAFVYQQGRGIAADLRSAVTAMCLRRRVGERDEGTDLDESTLDQIASKNPDVRPWQSVIRGRYPDTVVAIVVDGSGSMSNAAGRRGSMPGGAPSGSMWHAACGAGAALAAGLATIPRTRAIVWGTPNYTYARRGIFTENNSEAALLSWFGQKPSEADACAWASSIAPSSGTECWGSNVRAAVPLLLQQKATRRVVILITDGGLTGSDCECDSTEAGTGLVHPQGELTHADEQAAALGVEVYGIAWGCGDAAWRDRLPVSRRLAINDPLPTRAWLRAAAKLLLQGVGK